MKTKKHKKLSACISIFISCSLIGKETVYSRLPEVGLLWVYSASSISFAERRKTEQALEIDLENNWGLKVVKHPYHTPLPKEAFQSLQWVLELRRLSQDLWDLIEKEEQHLERGIGKQGQKILAQQTKILARLSRGVFGPEIQEAKMVQAAWELLWKNKEKASQLLEEAMNLHPQGKVIWQREASTPLGHVFESLIIQSAERNQLPESLFSSS